MCDCLPISKVKDCTNLPYNHKSIYSREYSCLLSPYHVHGELQGLLHTVRLTLFIEIKGKEHKDSYFVIVSLITDTKETISECQIKKFTHRVNWKVTVPWPT